MSFEDVILQGQHVRLEPLNQSHKTGLALSIADGQLHQLMVTNVPHPERLDEFLSNAETEQQADQSLAFATIDQASDQVIGSTRFMNTDWSHQRTEIGCTFIAKSKQRTAINTEAKLLMLTHAFEVLDLNRVAFRTDFLNQRSRTAIERLGAKFEGLLRQHMVMSEGRIRDTMVFSIINSEWPSVKKGLREKLKR